MRAGWAAQADAAAHVIVPSPDDELTIAGDAGHHLSRSLRLRPGETVTAVDGAGNWRTYVIATAGRGTVALRACGELMVEPRLAPALEVAFGLGAAAQASPEQRAQIAPLMAQAFGATFWWALALVIVAFVVALVLLPKRKPEPLEDEDAAEAQAAALMG